MRRKDEQATGEECHQRQHVHVDAIRARRARAGSDARLRPIERQTGGELSLQSIPKSIDIDAGPDAQIDSRNRSKPIECALRGRDVHHGEALRRVRAHQPAHLERDLAQRHLECERIAGSNAEPARRSRREEQSVRAQHVEPVFGLGNERGLDGGSAKCIEADDFQHIVAIGELG
ncbi:MAG TPA: hypothetical protein VFF43_09620, partial [Caldimonas sp.]|nr:hypothetical protein [Caldimonas sp.]